MGFLTDAERSALARKPTSLEELPVLRVSQDRWDALEEALGVDASTLFLDARVVGFADLVTAVQRDRYDGGSAGELVVATADGEAYALLVADAPDGAYIRYGARLVLDEADADPDTEGVTGPSAQRVPVSRPSAAAFTIRGSLRGVPFGSGAVFGELSEACRRAAMMVELGSADVAQVWQVGGGVVATVARPEGR